MILLSVLTHFCIQILLQNALCENVKPNEELPFKTDEELKFEIEDSLADEEYEGACATDKDCQYGGECILFRTTKFCDCKPGLEGDRCEIITDCVEKYKNCTEDYGICWYNEILQEAVCTCPQNNSFDDQEYACKACDCGDAGYCSFVNGRKTCDCVPGYASHYGTCEACDCGLHGYCKFIDGLKTCKCQHGYANYAGECMRKCNNESNGECQNGGVCMQFSYDGDTFSLCQCKKFVTGGRCEIVEDCATGMYQNCTGENGVCSYDQQKEDAVCTCYGNRSLHDQENVCKECDCGGKGNCSFINGNKTCECIEGYADLGGFCKATCQDDSECQNGGLCSKVVGGSKFCECKPGIEGDQCETVIDCSYGRYRNCKKENDTCFYDLEKETAVCICSGNKVMDPYDGTCKDCDCGVYGVCSFNWGKKICSCSPLTAEKDGKCVECDCGSYGICIYEGGAKKCICSPRTIQRNGKCVVEDYGSTTNSPKLTTPTNITEQDCDCGNYSHHCTLDRYGHKLCLCHFGYTQINGYCYWKPIERPETTTTTPTLQDCYCGRYSHYCYRDRYGRKLCLCHFGYAQIDGYCYAKDGVRTTEGPRPRTSTTERPRTTERDCYCGKNSYSCYFDWYGRKECRCRYGYVQIDDYCIGLCTNYTCFHGKCQVLSQTYECICDTGYTGARCETKIETKSENNVLFYTVIASVAVCTFLLLSTILCICMYSFFVKRKNKNSTVCK
ncbi:uncharacterized protein CDAR_303841 [Caerostris darwini]|uniref:EGF-like domain-containing protein n=1 Tax=Caerostris darwini TaxID=1538125 RepID=A0AAV4T730_9ARAC|nr:uncharacterized protein CDAR_303841 [Caerostris darwini]